jgi:hypothetical protein
MWFTFILESLFALLLGGFFGYIVSIFLQPKSVFDLFQDAHDPIAAIRLKYGPFIKENFGARICNKPNEKALRLPSCFPINLVGLIDGWQPVMICPRAEMETSRTKIQPSIHTIFATYRLKMAHINEHVTVIWPQISKDGEQRAKQIAYWYSKGNDFENLNHFAIGMLLNYEEDDIHYFYTYNNLGGKQFNLDRAAFLCAN